MDPVERCFTIEKKGEATWVNQGYCLANFQDQFVFIIVMQGAPRRYSLAEDRWEEVPSMLDDEVFLLDASACCSPLGDKVYVFYCPQDENSCQAKNHIAILHNAGASISSSFPQEGMMHWQMIEVP